MRYTSIKSAATPRRSGHDLLLLHLPLQQFQLQLLLVQLQVHLHQLLLHGKIMVWPTLVLYHANGWSRQLPRALNALLLLWPWPQFPLLALRPHLSRLRRFVGCPIDFRQEATIGLRRGDPFTTLRMAAPHHDMELSREATPQAEASGVAQSLGSLASNFTYDAPQIPVAGRKLYACNGPSIPSHNTTIHHLPTSHNMLCSSEAQSFHRGNFKGQKQISSCLDGKDAQPSRKVRGIDGRLLC